MKRTLVSTVYNNTRSKRPRLTSPFNSRPREKPHVVAATHVHNFMINDTLVDWLKSRSRRGTRSTPVYSFNPGFTDFILRQGIEFERELIKYLNKRGTPVVTVSEFITDESCRRAIDLMKEGVPVLHSVPVRNNYNKTHGIIDLLVRSDHLSDIVEENPLSHVERKTSGSRLSGNYHYVVIDIKFSTLPLRADSTHLLNSGHYPAYKAQTLIYTQAIGRIQGYTAPYAFILGRRWKYTSKKNTYRSYNCLDRLGKIDFNGVDKSYVRRTKNALAWVRAVRQKGSSWSINPPSRKELYPNMCLDSGHWNGEKRKIAERVGELTSIWNVGVKQRNHALEIGVTSWKDNLCTASTMKMNGKRAPIIDKIMAINRQLIDNLWPKKIQNNINGWKDKVDEVFVDFETLSDIFSGFKDLPKQKSSNMIFMIGVGWESEGKWQHCNFICNAPTLDEEYRIMDEFMIFMSKRGNPRANYWHAEKRFWTAAENRQFERTGVDKDRISDDWLAVEWCDMYHLFRSEPIVIRGCFKFGLKNIAKAMRKHGMIRASIGSSCNSGMMAMVKAWKCYQTSSQPATSDIMLDIATYNEFDCKVLWEILTYLRLHHT